MFDLVVELTAAAPGSTHEVTSIKLKREAFEKWRTGYARPYASSSRHRLRPGLHLREGPERMKER
jgi:hypothetical protein